jgi:hypothetical protein
MIEIAGPERAGMNEFVARYLKAIDDQRAVEADVHARYFGSELDDRSLVPGDGARLEDPLRRMVPTIPTDCRIISGKGRSEDGLVFL